MITFNRNAGTFYRQNTPQVNEMRSYLKSQPKSRFGNFIKNFGGPVAGGILGLGSQIFNGVMSSIQQQKEYDQQLEQWRRENFYNHPINQRTRLQAAGLNPAAAAGDIAQSNTAGGLSSVPSADAIKSGVIDVSSLVESLQAISQVEKIAADKDLVTSNIALAFYKKIAEQVGIRGKELENMMSEIKVGRYPKILDSEIYKNTAQGDHSAASAEDLVATRESRIYKALSEGNYSQARADSERAILDVEIALKEAQTDAAREQANLNAANVLATNAQIAILEIDSQIKSKDLNAYEQRFLWEKELNNQHLRLNKLAIAKGASEAEIAKLDAEYQSAINALNVDENGEATGYAVFKDFMDSAGSAIGIAVGAAIGTGGRLGATAIATRVPKRTPIGFR